jgi:PAS domain S-box-containing protein
MVRTHAPINIDELCRAIVHDGPDAIVCADNAGLIQFWNHAAERIFGYSADDALGKSLDIIIPEPFRARHWEAYSATVRTGITRYGDGLVLAVPAIRKDGASISIEFSIFPFRNQNDHLVGIAAILRNVTR